MLILITELTYTYYTGKTFQYGVAQKPLWDQTTASKLTKCSILELFVVSSSRLKLFVFSRSSPGEFFLVKLAHQDRAQREKAQSQKSKSKYLVNKKYEAKVRLGKTRQIGGIGGH